MCSTASLIGDPQVRNKGTIGGSLAHADPASDWPGVLVALDATINVTGNAGGRSIPANAFFMGLFTTALEEGEIILSITIPKDGITGKATYMKFAQPASRYAIVGCAVYMEKKGNLCTDIRIAFNGVSGHAFRDTQLENQLRGKVLDSALIHAACLNAASDVHVMSDHFASENYRKHLASVFAERAVTALC
jgi:carbon-monoxide dehydrogenase medium subunit